MIISCLEYCKTSSWSPNTNKEPQVLPSLPSAESSKVKERIVSNTFGSSVFKEDCEEDGERAAGVYFYDGTNVIYRDCSIDPDGGVPKTFKAVSEFPPDYWDKPKYVVDNWLNECTQQFHWHTGDSTFSQLNLNEFEWEFGENPESNSKSELFDGIVKQYYIHFEYNNKKYAVIGFYKIGDEQREWLNKNTISVSNIPKKVWETDQVFKDYDYVMQ